MTPADRPSGPDPARAVENDGAAARGERPSFDHLGLRDPNDGPRPRGPGAAAPLFLARNRYRARRLRDVARLMPVLAALVWLFPLLWRGDLPGMGGTARSAVFLFAGWAVLIVGTVLLSRRIELSDPAEATPTDPPA